MAPSERRAEAGRSEGGKATRWVNRILVTLVVLVVVPVAAAVALRFWFHNAADTWIGSSYTWASTADWARLGQLQLKDGSWNGRQVLPTGRWALAGTPAAASVR
jgi:CubicO group peptidase (beta-lactamase class C family)